MLHHQLMTFFKNGQIWRETSSNFEFERQQLKTVASQLQIAMLKICVAQALTIIDARFRSRIDKINVNNNTGKSRVIVISDRTRDGSC